MKKNEKRNGLEDFFDCAIKVNNHNQYESDGNPERTEESCLFSSLIQTSVPMLSGQSFPRYPDTVPTVSGRRSYLNRPTAGLCPGAPEFLRAIWQLHNVWQSPSKRQVPSKGEIPTPDEFIKYAANKIKK